MRAFMDEDTAPHEAVVGINRALCRQGAHGRFVTLFVAVLDVREGVIRFCNAGHNPPILARADGTVARLDDNATALALAFEG